MKCKLQGIERDNSYSVLNNCLGIFPAEVRESAKINQLKCLEVFIFFTYINA
jgi:hypothetical protein